MISDRLPASTKGKSIKILLCGPPPMTNVMKKYLEELDYEKCKTVSKIDDQVFCWVIFSFSCHFLFFLRGDGFCFPIPSFSRVTRLTYIFLFFIWWWYRFLKKQVKVSSRGGQVKMILVEIYISKSKLEKIRIRGLLLFSSSCSQPMDIHSRVSAGVERYPEKRNKKRNKTKNTI